jgi:predicted ATPase
VSEEQTRQHDDCMQRFIDLANELKDEGVAVNVVSWALMTASGIYATYSVVGNSGGLNPSGVDKVADAYRQNLLRVQELKKAQQGSEPAD